MGLVEIITSYMPQMKIENENYINDNKHFKIIRKKQMDYLMKMVDMVLESNEIILNSIDSINSTNLFQKGENSPIEKTDAKSEINFDEYKFSVEIVKYKI